MRKVFDTNGTDVTSSVVTYLQGNNTYYFADLFWFQLWNGNSSANPPIVNFFLTSFASPVAVTQVQMQAGGVMASISATYQKAVITRSDLEYSIGFEANNPTVTWYADNSVQYLPYTTPTLKQAVVRGFFREAPFWIHRAFFSQSAPGATLALLGTTLMFRGFIRSAESARDYIKFTLTSLMDIFQHVQVPTQRVEPGTRVPPFIPEAIAYPSWTGPLGTSTPFDIQFTVASAPADHTMRDQFILGTSALLFTVGNAYPPPIVYRIRDNIFNNTPSANTLHIYPYEPILLTPITSLGAGIGQQTPLNNAAGLAPGFPYVPGPESGI